MVIGFVLGNVGLLPLHYVSRSIFDMLVSTRQILAVRMKVYSLNHNLTTLDSRFLPLNSDSKVICRKSFEKKKKEPGSTREKLPFCQQMDSSVPKS